MAFLIKEKVVYAVLLFGYAFYITWIVFELKYK